MKHKAIDHILRQQVTRREFLLYLGATILAVTGVSGFIKNLTKHQPKSIANSSSVNYGSGSYGGKD